MSFDAIKSGLGGEQGDTTVRVISHKPIWRVKPLPLSQVDPTRADAPARVGPPPSLQTSCLDTISSCFHEYPPDALVDLPQTHIQRILAKVRSDRSYPDAEETTRPDQATLWAYSVLADPAGTERDLILGLYPQTTLRQLVPNPALDPPDHPFIHLPKLYATLQPESPFRLLTTISFDGASLYVADDTIMSLRYATNLTVLSMRDCKGVTDTAVRLLSSALILPGDRGGDGQGMWRLRAWFLKGCTGIGDKSMRALARWPGLVALDIRDTSCTAVASQIYNKASQDLFSCQLADMQPVNSSLRQLFALNPSPSSILAGLNATLLGPSSSGSSQYRALHLTPNYQPLNPEYMPDPPLPPHKLLKYSETRAYRTGGIGQVYGSGVRMIKDDGAALRSNVRTALKMQAMDDGLIPEERYEWMTEAEQKKHKKQWKAQTAREEKAAERARIKVTKGYKEPKVPAVKKAATVPSKQVEREEVKGEAGMMLVRVGQEGWDRLTWTVGASVETQKSGGALMGSQRTERKANLVGDILGLIQPSASLSQAGPACSETIDLASSPMSSPSHSQSKLTPIRTNPFAAARRSPSQTPFAYSQNQNAASSSSPEMTNSIEGSQGKKRRFGGVDASQGDVKRRGMAMFTKRT